MWKAFLALALLSHPFVGLACTTTEGYRVPTNVELIEAADLVVLARVRSAAERFGDSPYPAVTLETVRTLKGVAPKSLSVVGAVLDRDGNPFPLQPTPLNVPHQSALWGACVRQAYHQGGLVVATFRNTSKGYVLAGGPFARSVEDVQGPNALWVRAAEIYVRLQSTNRPSNRRNAFASERRKLLRLTRDSDAQAIAEDIRRYLTVTYRH